MAEQEAELTFHIAVEPGTSDEEIQGIVDILFQRFINNELYYDPETGEVLLEEEEDEWMIKVPSKIISQARAYQEKEPSGFLMT